MHRTIRLWCSQLVKEGMHLASWSGVGNVNDVLQGCVLPICKSSTRHVTTTNDDREQMATAAAATAEQQMAAVADGGKTPS